MAIPFTSLSLLLSFFLIYRLPLLLAQEEHYNHPTCNPFKCGGLIDIKFPFYNISNPGCGVYPISCSDSIPKIWLEDLGAFFIIEKISYPEKQFVLQDPVLQKDLQSYPCLSNFRTPVSLSASFGSTILNIFSCKHDHGIRSQWPPKELLFFKSCKDYDIFFSHGEERIPRNCKVVRFPIFPSIGRCRFDDLLCFLNDGFAFHWDISQDCNDCFMNGGLCHRTHTAGNFSCKVNNIRSKGGNRFKSIAKGLFPSFGGLLLLCTFLIFATRGFSSYIVIFYTNSKTNETKMVEEFLKNYGASTVKRFQYSDVKKMTNSLRVKLGQGGYGAVFKGKLDDGRLVAVKVLNKAKGNGEDFINEVATIGRTYHVNIVTLLGFCSEGLKRALIYEFVPNGSLEKFIYADNSSTLHPLGWEKLYQIAIGIARGLEYLHCRCNIRILHFDIKPHNILLDEQFCPKIADFGLAKLCSPIESIISMAGARGTAGYIAPEVFCRNFGGVSYKSDVYSYGMMVLEMVGGRKNISLGVDKTSEIYFPDWIYKNLISHGDLLLDGGMTEAEQRTAKKMIFVGLWCIQTNPANRPSMDRVIEMLEGTLEGMQIPPKPFLSFPSRRTYPNSSTTTS